jgi:hypothetical protein
MADLELPKEVRDAVLRELFSQVESLGWESMAVGRKTQQYSDWVDHPLIGGELADNYTAEGIRVWLKDGPLKEYARALEGFSSYAQYLTKRLAHPSKMVESALGPGWEIVPGSIREKPMHCVITDGEVRRYVCWGKPGTFRDLLWAAVSNAVTTPTRPLIIVFLREGEQENQKTRDIHERIAEHCALDLAYVRRELESR